MYNHSHSQCKSKQENDVQDKTKVLYNIYDNSQLKIHSQFSGSNNTMITPRVIV